MAAPRFFRPTNMSVTVRLDDDLLTRIDDLATKTNRSRAGMLRELILRAQPTGVADVACPVAIGAEGDGT